MKALNSQRMRDEWSDLINIVRLVSEFEKLTQLIENAKGFAMKPKILSQLDNLLLQIESRETVNNSIEEQVDSSNEDNLGTGRRWAVLVGVNEYEDDIYGRLQVSAKDAKTLHAQLVQSGYDTKRMHLLADDQSELPTRINILTRLTAVAQATEPDDLLLFFYSGHGDQDGGESYLVARDGQEILLADTAIPITRIKDIMKAAPARAKVIILDACHSGANIGGKGTRRMSPDFIRHVFEEAEGLAILSSCKQNEPKF